MKPYSAQLLVSVSISLLLFTALSKGADDTDAKARAFWDWFRSHSTEFGSKLNYLKTGSNTAESEKDSTKIIAETKKQLQAVHPGLAPVFGFTNGKNELVITANGDTGKFAAAIALAQSAPDMPGWMITALKPRRNFDADEEVRYGTVLFKLSDLRYSAVKNKNGVFDLVIYFPMDVARRPDGFISLARHLVIDAVGERLESTIGQVTTANLPEPANQDLLKFSDIYADISAWGK